MAVEKKPYILILKYGMWQNEMWFIGEDSEETDRSWESAKRGLTLIGECTSSPQEFSRQVIAHFEGYGFSRILK